MRIADFLSSKTVTKLLAILCLSLLYCALSFSPPVRAEEVTCNNHCWWSIGEQAWTCPVNTTGPATKCVLHPSQGGGADCIDGGACGPGNLD